MIDYNLDLLNHNDLSDSFFCMSKGDPTTGFEYNASSVFGPTYPPHAMKSVELTEKENRLQQRLIVGSHLARHLRHELESQKGYTSTVGIATNKILSKLVGNVHKPKNQTTIMPPFEPVGAMRASINEFLDLHDIGKIPGIGFKSSQKIRAQILGRQAEFSDGLVYGGTKESVTVLDVRSHPAMGPELLEEILGGPGAPKGIGGKVWELIHGVDDSEVGKAKRVPSQISQEDSYMKYLRTFEQVREQLHLLGERLIRRMQIDLMDDEDKGAGEIGEPGHQRYWLAHPRTLRLSTRPRPPPGPDGVRARTFHRISRSAPMPNFVFSLTEAPFVLAQRMVDEALVPMFRALHQEKAGWNLSLINVAATNMAGTAADSKESEGRDIGKMFRRQDEVLKEFRVTDESNATDGRQPLSQHTMDDQPHHDDSANCDLDLVTAAEWDSDASENEVLEHCNVCQSAMPSFAMPAHTRYHELND